MPPIWSQGGLGSCTAHAGPAAWCFDRHKQNLEFVMPSRLFVYYNEREYEGTEDHDSGASIRDCFKTMAREGVCDEALWPYRTQSYKIKPSQPCYDDANKRRDTEYAQVGQSLTQLKACIAGGFPFVFGFTVYQSFISSQVASTGMMPMPNYTERTVGGHAVCAVGYNSRNYFLIRNSWGPHWGDPDIPGHFWMPPQYICDPNLCA